MNARDDIRVVPVLNVIGQDWKAWVVSAKFRLRDCHDSGKIQPPNPGKYSLTIAMYKNI
jgi:hypothetical protein